jgi:N-acetylglucosamine-6-phosphate deacetylase
MIQVYTGPDHPHGAYASPGWVDLQVNGFAGEDFNAASPDCQSVGNVARALAGEGVHWFFPTVITSSPEQMAGCLEALVRGMKEDALARNSVRGFHLEGPWISPAEGARGAHPLAWVQTPEWDTWLRLQEAADGHIRVVTLAPELPGALPFIERLVSAGVLVSLGHHLATQQQIRAAMQTGARLCTHLGNGLPAILARHPNPIWDQLAEEELWASVIYDGHHLPESMMRILPRAKGPGRMILVSDAAAPARCAPGIYDASIGGRVELNAAGRLSLQGTPYLAGAALGLKEGVANMVKYGGVTLPEACAMASTNVWKLLGETPPQGDTFVKIDG